MSSFEQQALIVSLQVALITLLISTPLALGLATLMARTRWPGKLLLDSLILLPLGLPPAVVGFGLLIALGSDGALGTWLHAHIGFDLNLFPEGAILAACVMTVPLMVRVLRPAFESTDPQLLPVARTLGASRWQAWWTITLPLVLPGITSAMALGLAAAWGESGATLVLAAALHPPHASHATAPVALVQSMLQRQNGYVAAINLSIVSLGIATMAVVISEMGRRRWRQHGQGMSGPARRIAPSR